MQAAKDYMMGKDSKRKRAISEVADSEDDELLDNSPNARRTRHDEKIARQLQEELDHEAAEELVSEDDNEGYQEQNMSDESDNFPASDPKGKGKAVVRPSPRGTRSAVKNVIPDSDEAQDDSDSVKYEPPPTKKQKIVTKRGGKESLKGKGKMPALSSESEDDIPRKYPRVCFSILCISYYYYCCCYCCFFWEGGPCLGMQMLDISVFKLNRH